MELKDRVKKLERTIGVYGYLLGVEGRTIETFLGATIGNDLWLIGLNDWEWQTVRDEILPSVLAEVERRKALRTAEPKCEHTFFDCQVPAGDSCQAIYHRVCLACHWDDTKGVVMPDAIWRGYAIPQIDRLNGPSAGEG